MKKIYLLAISGFLILSCKEKQTELAMAHEEVAPTFNTEAVTKFWEVVDVLKNDEELNDSLWNSYFGLTGNKRYMEKNRSEAQALQHREFLELYFRPSLADSLILVSQSGELQNNDIFQNLKYIKDNENSVRKYSDILTSPEYLPVAIELTKKHLPKNRINEIPENLTIYIQAITYDAAVQDSSMYFGLSIVHDFDKLQQGTVAAHELHHVMRKKKEITNTLTARDSASMYVISKVNNEGAADLIDKVFVLKPEYNTLMGPLFKQILLNDIEPVIKKLDEALVKNAGESDKFVSKREFDEIIKYFSGHIPGFYMAEVIKRNGMEQELIESCDNPFNIFYLYNESASSDDAKPVKFSPEAMEYLKVLEEKAFEPTS